MRKKLSRKSKFLGKKLVSVESFIYLCTDTMRRQAAFRYRPNEFVFTLNLHSLCR